METTTYEESLKKKGIEFKHEDELIFLMRIWGYRCEAGRDLKQR